MELCSMELLSTNSAVFQDSLENSLKLYRHFLLNHMVKKISKVW